MRIKTAGRNDLNDNGASSTHEQASAEKILVVLLPLARHGSLRSCQKDQ